MISFIHKIPIVTTLLSAWFAWKAKGKPTYILWWLLGVVFYGLGTLTESWVGLFGWNEVVFKAWYILGALLGGFPLAQGSVYLLLRQKVAHVLSAIFVVIILVTAVLVALSPVLYELVEPTRLTGKVLAWREVRLVTPFINIYAFIFLVGGAAWSSYRYSRERIYRNRFIGNLLIAIGGLLPGIGGSFTKFGYTEVLYVTELLGIICIYLGYQTIRKDSTLSIYSVQNQQG
jgi:hypothetical protein